MRSTETLGETLRLAPPVLCEIRDFRTARKRKGRTCTRKSTGAAESRRDEEASALGGRLPAKHRLIAAAKADIELHTTAPVAVARPSHGWTPGRCLGGCGVPGDKA